MTSLFDQAIKDGCDRAFAKMTAPDGWLTRRLRRDVKWILQGFEPGYGTRQREAFTATVANRIHEKARKRLVVCGIRLWRVRYPLEWCATEAERIVSDWLDDEHIKFGDPAFHWADGQELADEDMSYWEAN